MAAIKTHQELEQMYDECEVTGVWDQTKEGKKKREHIGRYFLHQWRLKGYDTTRPKDDEGVEEYQWMCSLMCDILVNVIDTGNTGPMHCNNPHRAKEFIASWQPLIDAGATVAVVSNKK